MAKNVYNRFDTTEKWDQVNKYNKELLEDFKLELRAEGKSDKTIKIYEHNIKVLFVYILEELENVKVSKLKKKHFRNYVLWLKDKGLSVSRINNLKSAASSMLNFASDSEDYEDDIQLNYVSKLKPMNKEQRREIVFLTDEQVQIIYDELMARENYRDALLVSLLYESTRRRAEIFQLKKDWIDVNKNVTSKLVKGKRGKMLPVFYFEKSIEAYKKYMEQRNDNNPDLWVDKDGESISYQNLYDRIIECRKILKDKCDIWLDFNPHSFRHSGSQNYFTGKHWACKGRKFSLEELQALMGHSDISTTKSYLKEQETDIVLHAFGINDKNN